MVKKMIVTMPSTKSIIDKQQVSFNNSDLLEVESGAEVSILARQHRHADGWISVKLPQCRHQCPARFGAHCIAPAVTMLRRGSYDSTSRYTVDHHRVKKVRLKYKPFGSIDLDDARRAIRSQNERSVSIIICSGQSCNRNCNRKTTTNQHQQLKLRTAESSW